MSATDELCKLLDERGVKYQKINEHVTWVFLEDRVITFFSDELGVSAEVSYPKPVLNGTKFLTPEQAIAATLGGGECKVVASSTDGLTTAVPKKWFELSCGHAFKLDGLDAPVACPVCGKAVKR